MIILFFLSGISSAAQQIKVACIGNSITAGSYPTMLGNLLGKTAYKVENDGVSGTTLLKSGDNPYWKNGKFNQVFALQPDIVTIKLGTNDTKPQNWDKHYGEFKRDYLAMIDTLKTLKSNPKLWIVLPVPVFSNSYDIRDSALQKIIPILKQIGQERSLPVIDANTPFKNSPKYFSDGVHPTTAGSDTIAHIIYRALMSQVSVHEAARPMLSGRSPDIVMTRANHSFSVFSPGVATLQLLDLRGSTKYTQTFPSPGHYVLNENQKLHGMYLVRIKSAGPTLYEKIILP